MYNKYADMVEGLCSDNDAIQVSAEFSYADGTKDTVTTNVKIRKVSEEQE